MANIGQKPGGHIQCDGQEGRTMGSKVHMTTDGQLIDGC